MGHLRLAFRTLARTPVVTTVAILSLALGIGANAAIFSMFDDLLLRPLPVPHPEQLVNLGAPGPKPGSTSCNMIGKCEELFSYPMFRDLQQKQTVFTGLAAHVVFQANLVYDRQTLRGTGLYVSGSYFPTLGIAPARGRLVSPADDRVVGEGAVAVLDHAFWRGQLGGDPAVLGRTITVDGVPLTVIGIAPASFGGTTVGIRPSVYVPLTMRGVLQPQFVSGKRSGFESRQYYWLYLFARRRPGVSMAQARAALNTIYHPIVTDVEAPLQQGLSEATMARFRDKQVTVADGRRGQSQLHDQARGPVLFLLAITAIVLLIACANVANLLLARGAARSTEMAVRFALGAPRGAVVRQLLAEALVLSLAGGALGLAVARWTLGALTAMMPSDPGVALAFRLHAPAVLFTAALAIGTGLLFGLYPALHGTRPDLITAIRSGSGRLAGTRAAERFRSSLVTAQIALAMALLATAGLFVRSLVNVAREQLGIEVDQVVTFGIAPGLSGYTPAHSAQIFGRVEQELAALPGVTGVSGGAVSVLDGDNWGNDVSVQGFQRGPDTDVGSSYDEVGPGYFRTLGTPLLAGREFTASDVAGAPKVAIVNEAFARKFGLGRDAVGRFMASGRGDSLDIRIVGLVKDAKYSDVKAPVPPVYFTPWRQDTTLSWLTFYVRTAGDPASLMHAIPPLVARVDPNLPVESLRTMTEQVRENVFVDRMISRFSAAFAVLATLLAAIGLYGVLAYAVAQRTREIGVRMALGADAGRVRRMVLRQVGVLTLIGGVIGLGGALLLARGAAALLFGLGWHDPVVMGVAAGVLALVALAAGYLPARRASRIDPMQALRYE